MEQPGRKFSNGNTYRYGFNGKESDNDPIQYDYGFRIYDPRLGRFKSVDPLTTKFSMLTPYQFASNSPIAAIDMDGKEAEIVVDKKAKEIHINVKFNYTDATMKVLEQGAISMNDIQNSFNYYLVPGADGETQATKDASAQSKLPIAELENRLGGKIARGGDGYFNVDKGGGAVYKVFFTLQIDKNLDPKQDKTVRELEAHNPKKLDEPCLTDEQGNLHLPISQTGSPCNTITQRSIHEILHRLGLPDYDLVPADNPFKTGIGQIQVDPKQDDGTHPSYGIGEIMDKNITLELVSQGSIDKIVTPAINAANKVKGDKVVTMLSGTGSQTYGKSFIGPVQILKTENP